MQRIDARTNDGSKRIVGQSVGVLCRLWQKRQCKLTMQDMLGRCKETKLQLSQLGGWLFQPGGMLQRQAHDGHESYQLEGGCWRSQRNYLSDDVISRVHLIKCQNGGVTGPNQVL